MCILFVWAFFLLLTSQLFFPEGVPTPGIDEVILWGQSQMHRVFLESGSLCGPDVMATRCPQRFGYLSLQRLMVDMGYSAAAAAESQEAAAARVTPECSGESDCPPAGGSSTSPSSKEASKDITKGVKLAAAGMATTVKSAAAETSATTKNTANKVSTSFRARFEKIKAGFKTATSHLQE